MVMEYPTRLARQASLPASAGRRGIRNGSSHHNPYISGRITSGGAITDQRRLGKIVNRNAALSRSITIRSTKLAVICTISCFNRDNRISTTTSVSDKAPESAGRRNRAIQKKFRIPHDNRKPSREGKSISVSSITTSAARCGAATASRRQMPWAASPAMAVAAEGPEFGGLAMDRDANCTRQTLALAGDDQEAHGGAGKPATCHKNVMESSWRRNEFGRSGQPWVNPGHQAIPSRPQGLLG